MRLAIAIALSLAFASAACTAGAAPELPACTSLGCAGDACVVFTRNAPPDTCVCKAQRCELTPSCASLGCAGPDQVCNRDGSCTCDGAACLVDEADAGAGDAGVDAL